MLSLSGAVTEPHVLSSLRRCCSETGVHEQSAYMSRSECLYAARKSACYTIEDRTRLTPCLNCIGVLSYGRDTGPLESRVHPANHFSDHPSAGLNQVEPETVFPYAQGRRRTYHWSCLIQSVAYVLLVAFNSQVCLSKLCLV